MFLLSLKVKCNNSTLVGVVYVENREYQRLAFSATPLPADTTLVLKTSSVGVSKVSRVKEEEEEGEGDACSLKGLRLGLVLELGQDGDDTTHWREMGWEGEVWWKVKERGTPAVLKGELWGRLDLRGAEATAGWRRSGLAGSCRSELDVRLLSGVSRWFR